MVILELDFVRKIQIIYVREIQIIYMHLQQIVPVFYLALDWQISLKHFEILYITMTSTFLILSFLIK